MIATVTVSLSEFDRMRREIEDARDQLAKLRTAVSDVYGHKALEHIFVRAASALAIRSSPMSGSVTIPIGGSGE